MLPLLEDIEYAEKAGELRGLGSREFDIGNLEVSG
jgi:hypothetical protein